MFTTNKLKTLPSKKTAFLPPQLVNKFSKVAFQSTKILAIFIGASLVLASCSNKSTTSENNGVSSHYVIKGLFEEKKDACQIDGQTFKNGTLASTGNIQKVDINASGQMEINEGSLNGDYYYITCSGKYKDEITKATSAKEITLKGFFSKASGIHNINVFTDLIADPVKKELATKLQANATDPASVFNKITADASKSIVKAMQVTNTDKIKDVSELNSAKPKTAGDVALLMANLNILTNPADIKDGKLTITPTLDDNGTVTGLGDIGKKLTDPKNIALVDDAIKKAKVDKTQLGDIGNEAKTPTDSKTVIIKQSVVDPDTVIIKQSVVDPKTVIIKRDPNAITFSRKTILATEKNTDYYDYYHVLKATAGNPAFTRIQNPTGAMTLVVSPADLPVNIPADAQYVLTTDASGTVKPIAAEVKSTGAELAKGEIKADGVTNLVFCAFPAGSKPVNCDNADPKLTAKLVVKTYEKDFSFSEATKVNDKSLKDNEFHLKNKPTANLKLRIAPDDLKGVPADAKYVVCIDNTEPGGLANFIKLPGADVHGDITIPFANIKAGETSIFVVAVKNDSDDACKLFTFDSWINNVLAMDSIEVEVDPLPISFSVDTTINGKPLTIPHDGGDVRFPMMSNPTKDVKLKIAPGDLPDVPAGAKYVVSLQRAGGSYDIYDIIPVADVTGVITIPFDHITEIWVCAVKDDSIVTGYSCGYHPTDNILAKGRLK